MGSNTTFSINYFSIEAFVLEMQTEYSKLDLWMNNAEIADSLLMEYDPYADHPEKLGTTITAVRLQLHENQVRISIYRHECTLVMFQLLWMIPQHFVWVCSAILSLSLLLFYPLNKYPAHA